MHLLPRHRSLLMALFAIFTVALVGLVVMFHTKTDEYAVKEAKQQALNVLLVHRATHAYVANTQRPEVYRLKSEGRLYQDYFSPKLMSFTYISRSIKDLLNEERAKYGLEPIYFKLASENPRNPINKADALEVDLLKLMNEKGIRQVEKVVTINGKKWLYLAVPIDPTNASCMKCHGDPKDAPAELVAHYGDKAGFFENPRAIRALISIRVPLDGVIRAANRVTNSLSAGTFLALSALYGLIAFFIWRIDSQEQRILRQNDDLAYLSVTDSLTGVLNRSGLSKRLEEQIGLAGRFRQPFSLLMLDLDHFKAVNDRHGHQTGDVVLKQFVDIIRDNLRVTDFMGRWGGEEFLVIAPHINAANAEKLAGKLCATIADSAFDQDIRMTVSIGVAEYRAGESEHDLIERADAALYQAKEGGRNRVVLA